MASRREPRRRDRGERAADQLRDRTARAGDPEGDQRAGPKPYGLTTLQYTTLSVLGRQGRPLSNAQLARRAYMTPQAMSEVIEALESKG